MRDDPRNNLRWLEQQLLDEERPQSFSLEEDDLMQRVDSLIAETPSEDAPLGNFSRKSKGARVEQAHINAQFDESAAVLTKSKAQLRREAKQAKIAEKKAGVNRNLKGLTFLAILEILGILAILGWWLQ